MRQSEKFEKFLEDFCSEKLGLRASKINSIERMIRIIECMSKNKVDDYRLIITNHFVYLRKFIYVKSIEKLTSYWYDYYLEFEYDESENR